MNTHLIFIVGTGRSGTHLIARSIGSHEAVKAYIEHPPFFDLSSKIAFENKVRKDRIKKLINKYKKEIRICSKESKIMLDKSHPNIWIIDELIHDFPKAKFIAVNRNAYSTISSMLRHEGVLTWFDKYDNKTLNPFLGVTYSTINTFKELPIESKCALRWKSHRDEIINAKNKYPTHVHVLNYEDFLLDTDRELQKVANFIGISNQFRSEKIINENLTKWRGLLSRSEIANIDIAIK